MRRLLPLLATSLLVACSLTPLSFSPAPSQLRAQTRAAADLVTIRWRQPQELETLAGSGLDIFGVDSRHQTVQARLTPAQRIGLQQQGYVLSSPQLRAAAQERQAFPSGYLTYAQLRERLQTLAATYPQLVQLEDVGDTWLKQQGQAAHDIWAIRLNGNAQRGKPTVLMTGGIHARELAPVEILVKLLELLTSGYGKDPRITQLLNSREVVILPMVNVDGRVKVEQGAAWHRKNGHGSGVDLNRNFDNHWNYAGLNVPESWKKGLGDPNSEIFSGSGPASEPETQVVQAMFQRFKPLVFVDMHSYGDMMLWPLGYSKESNPLTPYFRSLYQRTLQPLGFKGGTSTEILYPTTATSRDYGYEQHGALSMTLEIGDSFRPEYGQTLQIWQKLQPHLLTILESTPG
ncbi:MAG: M14 family zinc carboxypeptidase [Candidatus Sericytochromatia bacterium]